jgi:hypothetical protein
MLYFALRSQQAHRRHVRPTRRGRPVRSGARHGPDPAHEPHTPQGRGVARQAGRGRIHRAIHRVPEARGGESAAADTRTRRGGTETASRTPQPLHNDTLCTSHASHSSRARQHSFRTRDAHEDTAHTKGSTRAASGLWGSPSPPAAQSPTHEAHQPPNLSTLIAPCRARSSPTAQPLEQHGLGRARYPILAHYGRIAPRRRRTPCRQPRAPPRSHTLHTHAQLKKGGLPQTRLTSSLRHFVHFVKGGRPQTRLTSSLRPLCHFSLSHHLVCHESTSQAHAYCDRPRRLCHATLSIHARGPFTRGVHSREGSIHGGLGAPCGDQPPPQ